ncbi:MAG: PhnD/SsuA/transferrin family substrate-binding protein, partial [Anaerolineae bacterium]
VLEVEVTRLVDGSGTEAAVAAPAVLEVEVTRLVPLEVTRVVPEEVVVEVTKSPLGSTERPIQLLFPPTVNTAVISNRTPALADFLAEATGRHYAVGILDSEQTVIEVMCTAPVESIGFLSATGYVAAHELCGVTPAVVGVNRSGLDWQAGMIVVRRDSGISSPADLDGLRWAVPDSMSIPNFLYFQALLAESGVEPGEIVQVPGDNTAMLAVLNGEADFASGSFVSPILPFTEREWEYGEDDPELWRRLGIAPTRSGQGFVIVNGRPDQGGYRVRDARSGIFDIEPTVFNETRIIALSAQIPNDTIAFGPDFPVGLSRQLVPLFSQFAAGEACAESICSADFYNWQGLNLIDDALYDSLRFTFETLDMSGSELMP